MRRLALVLAAAALAAAAPAAAAPTYYLALGDSLAAGTQPPALFTKKGYADQLLALLRKEEPSLRLVNLGCPGETAGSLIEGGGCTYEHGSQLAEAIAFLKAHPGATSLVTLDIGANDVLRCDVSDAGCFRLQTEGVGQSLGRILRELRSAAPHVRIVGLDYYDPLLAAWLSGPAGREAARGSIARLAMLNRLERSLYERAAARVAAVADAFATAQFQPLVPLRGSGRVPFNVARICAWTLACSRGDVHPNTTGYGVIARAIRDALR
jgi:lysophospholipase L1-like esterase